MHVYVILAHPSGRSFSRSVFEAFTRGLSDAGHSFEVGDLYAMGFRSEMDETQYLREISGNPDLPCLPTSRRAGEDQPLRCPCVYLPPLVERLSAKLKGWFDRVLTCGYAYLYDTSGARKTRMSVRKALVICSTGHTAEHLEATGVVESMRRVMIQDRLLGIGVKEAHLEILGGMMPLDDSHREENLRRAYELGRGF